MTTSQKGRWSPAALFLALVALPIGANAAEPFRAPLELEPFEVWTSDAAIEIFGAGGKVVSTPAPPAARHFSGRVANDPDSLVFLAVDGERIDGIVWRGDKRFGIGSRKGELFIEETSEVDEERFECEFDRAGLPQPVRARALAGALSTSTARSVLNLAIETDYEMFVNAGSSSANVVTFVGNLVAALSTIYRRDLNTEVRISYLGVHTTASDPFTVVPGQMGPWDGSTVGYSTVHALMEFGDRWHNAAPSSAKRSSTVLLSGKIAGGVAWLRVLCKDDFEYQGHWGGRYAFCGSIDPPNDLSVPNPDANPNYQAPSSNYWPLRHLAHELGHNVGSPHSHCIALGAADQQTYGRSYVDYCSRSESGCYFGFTSIPPERGTIMSYCNQLGGGSAVRYTFGQNGEASHVIPPAMRADVQEATPAMSAIAAPSSVAAGASASASVANVDGVSYAWTIQNGTINGSPNAASINFTATAHPVTLAVTATNTMGCAVTDSINVGVTVACAFSISPAAHRFGSDAATGTVAVTSNCAWTATSNDPWIAIVSSGNGSVSYSVAANLTGATRTGTMTIAGQTFTVTQTAFAASAHTDFDGDGLADLFWRSPAGGDNAVWLMNGASIAASALVQSLDGNWSVEGIGDFDADGRADVLWRNAGSAQTAIWFMNGAAVASGAFLPPVSDVWSIDGVGDFDADGRADILWRNSATNDAVVWLMNGASITSSAWVAAPQAVWSVDGVGDFNGDARADILWRNTSTSESVIWLMNGAAISNASYIATPSPAWTVAGVGDFNRDGMTDIVWRNSSTTETVLWLMHGLSILTAAYLPPAPSQGHLQSIADFDADGHADLAWRNATTGENAMWFMDGASVSSSTYFQPVPDTGFNMVGPR